jgi:alpha-galactosidase
MIKPWLALSLLAMALLCVPAHAWDDGLARTPPMGWNSWNRFGCNVSETLVREMADAMVGSGMRDAGYEYLVVDDCWQVARAPDGTIIADPLRFPNGIAALAEYVHGRGLKLGIYTDAGFYTCQGRPGSYGYEQQDAETYAAWGVDYVKIDWCYAEGLDARTQYALWRDVLAMVDRPIVFSISTWGLDSPWTWGPGTGHLWRTTYDIWDTWQRILEIADFNVHLAAYAGPGGWNDPDMLEVGNSGLTDGEYRAHFSLWAIMAAPLIAGNDLRIMSPASRALLTNPEVIAVDQDPAGIQGTRVHDAGDLEVWAKPLAERGARAVVLLNRGESPAGVSVNWDQIGLAAGEASVRDLWARIDLGTFTDSFRTVVPPHGSAMIRVSGAEPSPPPPGTWYLSDLLWVYALNGLGPVERDASNGGEAAGDGEAITLDGIPYAKGLGTHAATRVRFRLGGKCRTFLSTIGVDDKAADKGSVVFQAWADGVQLYDSGVMTGTTPAQQIRVSVAGKEYLELIVGDAGDDNQYDLADWADGHLVCWAPATTVYLPFIRQE